MVRCTFALPGRIQGTANVRRNIGNSAIRGLHALIPYEYALAALFSFTKNVY